MHCDIIDWIESAKHSKRIHFKRITIIESKADLNSVITRAERNGLQPVLSETQLILIPGNRLTLQLNDLRTLVIHGNEAIVRTHVTPTNFVTQIPSSAPRKLPRFNFLKPKSTEGGETHC